MSPASVIGKRHREAYDESVQPVSGSDKALNGRNVRRQLWSSDTGVSLAKSVKAALTLSTVPEELLCRNTESAKIEDFCSKYIKERRPGSLYVCGCPGTGKTLTIETIKRKAAHWSAESGGDLRVVGINCMSLTEPRQIFQKILDSCPVPGGRSSSGRKSLSPLAQVQALLRGDGRSKKKSAFTLIVVDEMDHLMTRDQSVLYDMFLLPKAPNSHCILIGIANAIDLTDRFLPNLRSLNCNPDVVTFPAYTKEQLLMLLKQRLEAFPFPVFDARALELCSRKVAAASGDMRKALDICRSALDIFESEVCSAKDSSEGEGCEDVSPPPPPIHSSQPEIVQIGHMASALSGTFHSAVVATIQGLPLHQQMVLCSAVRKFKGKQKDASLAQVASAYIALCHQTGMVSQGVPAVAAMVEDLSEQALLTLGKPSARDEKNRRVTLKVHEDDVSFALQGVRFFRNILSAGPPTCMGA